MTAATAKVPVPVPVSPLYHLIMRRFPPVITLQLSVTAVGLENPRHTTATGATAAGGAAAASAGVAAARAAQRRCW